jgi:tetratricopeptide (TPR) repeat protein
VEEISGEAVELADDAMEEVPAEDPSGGGGVGVAPPPALLPSSSPGVGAAEAAPRPPVPTVPGAPSSQAAPSPPAMPAAGSRAEPIEELDADLLETSDVPAVSPKKTTLDAAIEAARLTQSEEGGARLRALYQRELETLSVPPGDRPRSALYHHEVGELLETRNGDEAQAVKAYAKALQSDPTLRPNLWAIRRIFQRRALWPNLLKLLDVELRFAGSPEERAEILVEKGQLLEDRLADQKGAREAYELAAQAWPGCLGAWMSLEKLCAREGDVAALRRVVRGLCDATVEPGRKVALLFDLGRLAAQSGAALDEILTLTWEAHAVARAARLAVEEEHVLGELERTAEVAGRTDEVLRAIEARVELWKRLSTDAPERSDLPALIERTAIDRRRQGEIARAAGDLDAAYRYLEEAVKLQPDEPLFAAELAEVAEAAGRHAELAVLLTARIERIARDARPAFLFQLAQVLRRAGKLAEAEACEADLAREAPDHLWLLLQRQREAQRAGDWEKLAQLYLAEAELASQPTRPTGPQDESARGWAASANLRAGLLFGDKLNRDAEAIAALSSAFEARPTATTLGALARAYHRGGRFSDEVALYERAVERAASVSEKERLYETIVALREDDLGDPAGAAAAQRRLCELEPGDVSARLRLVELDRAAQRYTDAASDLLALQPLVSDERRVEVLLERADLLEHRLGDAEGAQAVYKEVLALRPGEPHATEAFESIFRHGPGKEEGRTEASQPVAWDDLAEALRREAESAVSPERAVRALLKLGELEELNRKRPEAAAAAYTEVLQRTPDHPAALLGLLRACEAAADHARAADTLDRLVETIEPPGGRARALVELGELYEDRIKDGVTADEAFARSAALEDSAHAAFGRFRQAVRARDAVPLSAALERLVPFAKEAAGALEEERAVVLTSVQVDEAQTVIDAVCQRDPAAGVGARLLAARLAARLAQPAALGPALGALAERSSDPSVKAALLRRGGVATLVGGDAAAAAARLREALAIVPGDAQALVALGDALPPGSDPEALAARAALSSGGAAVECHLDAAEAYEAVGRLQEAARQVGVALSIEPQHLGALETERRVARAGGDAVGAAHATYRLASAIVDDERAGGLLVEAGHAFEEAGQREAAAVAYRAALDRTPLDGGAFARCRDLLTWFHLERGEAGPLLELYGERLARISDSSDRATLLLERADLCRKEGDLEAAERDLREALEADPGAARALLGLASLVAAKPTGGAEAKSLWRRYLASDQDREARRAALLQLAELEARPGPGQSVADAVALFDEALQISSDGPTLDRLAGLLLADRQWQRATDALRRLVEHSPDGTPRATVEMRVATVYQDGFGDPHAATEALRRALGHDPLNLDALARLENAAQAGHLGAVELDDCLERAVSAAREAIRVDPSGGAPYSVLAAIAGWRRNEDARAIASQALELASGRRPAPRDAQRAPERAVTPEAWARLLPDPARSIAVEVWRAASEGATKLYAPTLDKLGLGKADRLNQKTLAPAYAELGRIAKALGVEGYELYRSSTAATCTAAGEAFIVGEAHGTPLDAAARFRLARALTLYRDRATALETIDDEELTVFFAACAKVAEAPLPRALESASPSKVEERAKALGKILGRKERKALGQLGPQLSFLPTPAQFRAALLEGAARTGLVISGDLGAALGELRLSFGRDPQATSLVVFALSDVYLSLRRELGLG